MSVRLGPYINAVVPRVVLRQATRLAPDCGAISCGGSWNVCRTAFTQCSRINGFQFTPPEGGWKVPEIQQLLTDGRPFRAHAFDLACAQLDIDHRLTKFNHPWTNGQVERMNRTIKDATVRRFYYETHDRLRTHLATFLDAYNFAKRLKSLRGLTPFERVCQLWTEQPERFRLNPLHHIAGLNI